MPVVNADYHEALTSQQMAPQLPQSLQNKRGTVKKLFSHNFSYREDIPSFSVLQSTTLIKFVSICIFSLTFFVLPFYQLCKVLLFA